MSKIYLTLIAAALLSGCGATSTKPATSEPSTMEGVATSNDAPQSLSDLSKECAKFATALKACEKTPGPLGAAGAALCEEMAENQTDCSIGKDVIKPLLQML